MAKFRLGDDGTLDTVVVCTACGHEDRYNDDGEDYARDGHEAFIAWAIETSESEHVCGDEGEGN